MEAFELFVLIVLIMTVGSVLEQRWKAKRRIDDVERKTRGWMDDLFGELDPEADPKLRKRVDDLEERVRSLERIATDPSERLKRDIDSL